MDQIQKNLSRDIEKSIGFKILSTTEAKAFLNMLIERDIFDISLSTIRRFWGIIPRRKASQHTLNKLSQFLGYKSFYDYVKVKNTFEYLFLDASVQRLRHKEVLTQNDFRFIASIFKRSGHTHFFTSLVEFGLMFEKWPFLFQLFDESQNKLLLLKDHRNTFLMSVSYQINIFLRAISEEFFETVIDHLLKIDGFKNNILFIYIDLININHRYGLMLDRIPRHHSHFEEKLFLDLISNLKRYLNGDQPLVFEIADQEIKKLPDVLKGRYYGYQVLTSTYNGDHQRSAYFFQKFKSNIGSDTYIRDYLHEFIHHLMLAKRFEMLDEIITRFYETLMDEYNTHSYLDEFIINLNEIIFKISINDTKSAEKLFLWLDTDKIIFGSYCDYYLIYYHIVGYHISNSLHKKNQHKLSYDKITSAAQFKRLDRSYLFDYFL